MEDRVGWDTFEGWACEVEWSCGVEVGGVWKLRSFILRRIEWSKNSKDRTLVSLDRLTLNFLKMWDKKTPYGRNEEWCLVKLLKVTWAQLTSSLDMIA